MGIPGNEIGKQKTESTFKIFPFTFQIRLKIRLFQLDLICPKVDSLICLKKQATLTKEN